MQNDDLQSDWKSWWQVLSTSALLVFSYFTMWLVSENHGFWWSMSLLPITTLLTTRTFVLYHDCIHNNLFSFWKVNQAVGNFMSHFTLTPNISWGGNHLHHHSHFGKLAATGRGDIPFATPRQYRKLGKWDKWVARMLRTPLMPFVFGGVYHYQMREPIWKERCEFTGTSNHKKDYVISDTRQSFVIQLVVLTAMAFFSPTILAGFLLSVYGFWVIGFFTFYIQHQHEGTVWAASKDWDHAESALRGSSYVKLNPVLEYFFASINYHHVHHWNSSIPNYSLKKVHEEKFKDDDRIYVIDSAKKFFECFDNKMWDPKEKVWIKEFPSV